MENTNTDTNTNTTTFSIKYRQKYRQKYKYKYKYIYRQKYKHKYKYIHKYNVWKYEMSLEEAQVGCRECWHHAAPTLVPTKMPQRPVPRCQPKKMKKT